MKTSGRYLEQGAQTKEDIVQHNLGSVNHSCNWEMSLALGNKDVSNLELHRWKNNIHTETCCKVTCLCQMNWLWLCYLAVWQLLSKLRAISSLAHITIRNMKAGLAREDRKLVTLKHDMNYVKRNDRLLLNQQVNHTFFSIEFPWKDQICIWSTTTLNLQGGKKHSLCRVKLGRILQQ